MSAGRITNPDAEMLAGVQAQLEARRPAIAQFHGPGIDPAVLQELNGMCAEFGAMLQIRFYGWYGLKGAFDAAVLRDLPEVRRLTVNCLRSMENAEVIAELRQLEDLHLGVFELPDGAWLADLPLENLKRLGLEENRKRNFDLSPLSRCQRLERLFIQGHTREIDAIAELPSVSELVLSGMPNRQRLDVINRMPALRNFRLILGSRDSIAEMAHDGLEKLTITWVRGLLSMGDLNRFPQLRTLIVEDQLKIEAIDLSGMSIAQLRVDNCKRLATLSGLDTLIHLEQFHAARTTLDLDTLRDRQWPAATKVVGLFSGSRKWNDATRDSLAARGYRQFPDQPAVANAD